MTKLDQLLTIAWFLAEAMRLRDEQRHRFTANIVNLVLAFDADTPEAFVRAIKRTNQEK